MILETLNRAEDNVVTKAVQEGSPHTTSEQQELVRWVMKKFRQFKKVRNRYDRQWLDYYKLFRGSQWASNRPRWKNSEIINLIFPTIQSQIPLQTDSRPKFSFMPTDPTDLPFANIMDKVGESDWEKYNWLQTAMCVILDGYIYGTGMSQMGYEQDLEYGIGAAVYKDVDIFYCYPDPECQDVNDQDSEGFFYVKPEPTERLKRKYPKYADFLKSDVKDWVRINKTELRMTDTGYFNTDREMPESTYGGVDDDTTIPRTLVLHYYCKPQDVEESVEQDEQGKKTYTAKKKYPKGRYICIANGIPLEDGPLPFEDSLIPFSKYNNYLLPREYWGISEIEQLESPQRVFNKILCFMLDSMVYCGNPMWIVDSSSDVDPETLSNIPGGIIEKTPGSEVRREPGVAVNPIFLQTLDRLIQWFNDTAGNSEFSKGNAPGGVTAASAIEQLISASRTRIRQKMRQFDLYMRTVGRQYANRVFQFYKAPRIYRLTNDQGANEFFKFNTAEEMDETGAPVKAAYVQQYNQNDLGEMMPGDVNRLILKGDLDIRVTTGSDLPFEAADKERKALALFDRQIIDAEEVLDQLNYPNKDKILQRIMMAQQQAQAAAMSQAATQQAQPPQAQQGVVG